MDEVFVKRTGQQHANLRKTKKQQARYRHEFRAMKLHGPLPLKVYPGYEIIAEYPLDVILELIPEGEGEEHRIKLDGYEKTVTIASDRLRMYKAKGVACVADCGRQGFIWRLETNHGNGAHLNLYAQDGSMMTKDHIHPKSEGGKDILSNYQPMCDVCNARKGSMDNQTFMERRQK